MFLPLYKQNMWRVFTITFLKYVACFNYFDEW